MSLVVVGSIAFDRVKTPFGERERLLGGAATHFALAASFFTDVRMVGVVGDDFGEEEFEVLRSRNINTEDIEVVKGGKSFFWHGEYGYDLNDRVTHDTQLNVFENFDPKLSDGSAECRMLFLGNIVPSLQSKVRSICKNAEFSALDSMDLWIDTARDDLIEAIRGVDVAMINDAEVRQLTDEPNLARAARKIMEWGPRAVVAKQGEYGAAMFTKDTFFALPAYPLESVIDPTGAGDSFAGGFLGYMDAHESHQLNDDAVLRRAMTYGSVMASFNVEEFGTERVHRLTHNEITERFRQFKRMTHFEEIPLEPRLHSK